jgi:4-hydroxy 2-oxovalerate aldolase
MKIIDVTLRDGGHVVDFDWPIQMAKDYYELLSSFSEITLIELGYWKQSEKSNKRFYNLDMDFVREITKSKGLKNVAVMIDYHYCSHDLYDYPTKNQDEISMIRLCIRKEDLKPGIEFGKKLKEFTGLLVSINIFNTSNYTRDELLNTCRIVSEHTFDFVYFADTHGSLDLSKDFNIFKKPLSVVSKSGTKTGFHLHDHSGKAILNYEELIKNGVESTDTSIRGMGKGSGNLKLEHVILNSENLVKLLVFIKKYEDVLSIKPNVYELLTAKYSLSDNYAKQGKDLDMDLELFDSICKKIKGVDKDTFNKEILKISLL